MEFLDDRSTILNLEKSLNYTDIRIENTGNYFKCHKCPVDRIGANLMLDCIEIEYEGELGLMYGGFQDLFTSAVVAGPITQLCSRFTIVVSLPDDNYDSTELQKNAEIVQHINERCLFKSDIRRFRECMCYENIRNVFIPNAPKPVLFNKLYFEDVYRLRFDYEIPLKEIDVIIAQKGWSATRASKCLYDRHWLSTYDCGVILKPDVS